jgi:hypothetical protein
MIARSALSHLADGVGGRRRRWGAGLRPGRDGGLGRAVGVGTETGNVGRVVEIGVSRLGIRRMPSVISIVGRDVWD